MVRKKIINIATRKVTRYQKRLVRNFMYIYKIKYGRNSYLGFSCNRFSRNFHGSDATLCAWRIVCSIVLIHVLMRRMILTRIQSNTITKTIAIEPLTIKKFFAQINKQSPHIISKKNNSVFVVCILQYIASHTIH